MENFNGNMPFEVLRKMPKKIPNTVSFNGCINVITNPYHFDKIYWEWLADEPNVYLAIGCHPQDSMKMKEMDFVHLENSMEHPKVVALGEFGLDEKWAERGILMDTQKDVFRSQVQMALKVNKPMVLHLRGYGALDSAKYILEEENVPKNWPIHLHAFTYSIDICKEWAEEYTSMKFGLVSENFDPEIVKNMPLNRLLLETDSPYFYPKELGNKGISIPNYISFVAKEIAHYKGIETYDVLDANLDNVNELYNIPSRNVIQKSEKSK